VEAVHVHHGELRAEEGGDPVKKPRVEDAMRMMSWTYIKRKVVPSVHCRTNNDVSEHEHVKPIEVMKVMKR
jgi:hypothetical protein